MEYKIIKNGVTIGSFVEEIDRDLAFDEYCTDWKATYTKKDVVVI